jgi:hypothetical protein
MNQHSNLNRTKTQRTHDMLTSTVWVHQRHDGRADRQKRAFEPVEWDVTIIGGERAAAGLIVRESS